MTWWSLTDLLIARWILIALRRFWYRLKGLLKGFWWPFRSSKSVKYFWSYGLNEVCDILLSKGDTLCTCVLPFHTWNTLLSPSPASLSLFLSHYTALLYLSTPQIYFGAQFPSSLLCLCSCNLRPGAWTLCNSNILILSFLPILPLMKWGHTFVWASHSLVNCIVAKTWCYVSASIWR